MSRDERRDAVKTERTTCLVIGGGPAGMVLGLLLARAGNEVCVLEKHADFFRDFRGDTVHPSTLDLLDELGLGKRFSALPQGRVHKLAFAVDNDREILIGDFRRLKVRHPYIAMVPQWDLLKLLAEAANKEPTFTLRMHSEVTELIQESGRVCGVRYRGEDGSVGEIRAALTVACDGRWSLAREQAHLRPKEFRVPLDVWWLRIPGSQDDDNLQGMEQRAAPGRFAVIIPRPDFLQIAYMAKKGSDAQLRAQGVERFRHDVAQVVPWVASRLDELKSMQDVKFHEVAQVVPWVASRLDELKSMQDVKFLDVQMNRLHRWHVDGLLCIGDAAHAMSPIGGVGINLAIQDAVAAAKLLARPLQRGTVTASTLARVRRRRLPPTIAVQLLQRLLHRFVMTPIIEGTRMGPPKPVQLVLRHFPPASYVPARLVGIGLRPEHAPQFARRPAEAA